jgi:hypothetical protein
MDPRSCADNAGKRHMELDMISAQTVAVAEFFMHCILANMIQGIQGYPNLPNFSCLVIGRAKRDPRYVLGDVDAVVC